jgi:hypothetical protein
MPRKIEMGGLKMNFALSREDQSNNKFNLLVCTFDAKWNNKCEIIPITVLIEVNWL